MCEHNYTLKMRLVMRKLGLVLVVITLALFIAFEVFYSSSSFTRHQRAGGRHRSDHLESSVIHDLQNCSCYMNYRRNHSREVRVNSSETHAPTQHTPILVTSPLPGDQPIAEYNDQSHVTITPVHNQRVAQYLSEPIDTHTYGYIHNPQNICFHENGTEMDIYILFFVPTAPGNFERRDAIRKSYGNVQSWPIVNGARSRTVFMLGATIDTKLQANINSEFGTHGDIVQETFTDSYLNLTRKTVMGLKWVTYHCRHARLIMKIDDDTTVNQPRILEIVKSAKQANFTNGHVFKKPIVDRNRKSKFYLSTEYFPASEFPPYMDGVGYIMSSDVVESVFHIALAVPLFPWEDVFVGMCLHKLGVELNHDDKFLYWGPGRNILGNKGVSLAKGHAIFTNLPKDHVWQIYEKLIAK